LLKNKLQILPNVAACNFSHWTRRACCLTDVATS